jgi:hypothetical protein
MTTRPMSRSMASVGRRSMGGAGGGVGDGEGEVERWKAQSEKYRSQLLSEKRAFSDARAALEKAAAQAREEADKFRCVLYRKGLGFRV